MCYFYRSAADCGFVAGDDVALSHHPPTRDHDVAHEFGPHGEVKVPGQIIGGQRRGGAVIRQNEIGGLAGFEYAKLYAETFGRKTGRLAEHLERLAERNWYSRIVALELGDSRFSPHVGTDAVGTQLWWPRANLATGA